MTLKVEIERCISGNASLYSISAGGHYELADFSSPQAARYSMVPAFAADNDALAAALHLLTASPCMSVVLIVHQGDDRSTRARRQRIVEASGKSRGWQLVESDDDGGRSVLSKRVDRDRIAWPLKEGLMGVAPRLVLRGLDPKGLGASRLNLLMSGPQVAPNKDTVEYVAEHDAQLIYSVRDDFGRCGAVVVGAKLEVDLATVAGVELVTTGDVGSVWRLGPWDGR